MATATFPAVQICQWRGIPIEGITGTCDREATLTGTRNGSGEQHLCTEHMAARDRIGWGAHSYPWVWPCQANGFVRHPQTAPSSPGVLRALPVDALRLCR